MERTEPKMTPRQSLHEEYRSLVWEGTPANDAWYQILTKTARRARWSEEHRELSAYWRAEGARVCGLSPQTAERAMIAGMLHTQLAELCDRSPGDWSGIRQLAKAIKAIEGGSYDPT